MDHGSEKGHKIRRLGKFLIFLGDAKRPTLKRCCLLCFQGFQVVFLTGNSVKLAAKTFENRWLEEDLFLLEQKAYFQKTFAVSFRSLKYVGDFGYPGV